MHSTLRRSAGALSASLLLGGFLGCATMGSHEIRMRSNTLDYLYPEGSGAVAARDVRLTVPVRAGIAFAPDPTSGPRDLAVRTPVTEDLKQALLGRVVAAFEGRQEIASVEVIPTSHLSPGGGFPDVDRLRQAFGVDLIVLVSYDQFQFSETTRSSIWYWTLVGAYLVKGEKNETRTMMDALVYDIPSRVLLFKATGQSSVGRRSTPVDVARHLRELRERGFDEAMGDLIAQLDVALEAFVDRAAAGTVRGEGTPAISMVDASGRPLTPGQGGNGAGLLGWPELLAIASLIAGALVARARRHA